MQRAPSFGEPKLGKNAPNIHHFPATGTRRLHTERKYSSLCPALAKKLPMEVIFNCRPELGADWFSALEALLEVAAEDMEVWRGVRG